MIQIIKEVTVDVSPSSRRAWIEMFSASTRAVSRFVALLAEGVDRNTLGLCQKCRGESRPPRGGRG